MRKKRKSTIIRRRPPPKGIPEADKVTPRIDGREFIRSSENGCTYSITSRDKGVVSFYTIDKTKVSLAEERKRLSTPPEEKGDYSEYRKEQRAKRREGVERFITKIADLQYR